MSSKRVMQPLRRSDEALCSTGVGAKDTLSIKSSHTLTATVDWSICFLCHSAYGHRLVENRRYLESSIQSVVHVLTGFTSNRYPPASITIFSPSATSPDLLKG